MQARHAARGHPLRRPVRSQGGVGAAAIVVAITLALLALPQAGPGPAAEPALAATAQQPNCQVFVCLTITAPNSEAPPSGGSVVTIGVRNRVPVERACPAECVQEFDPASLVRVTARPNQGFAFAGFGGDCTGTGECALRMTSARRVTASFVSTAPEIDPGPEPPPDLPEPVRTVAVDVAGNGTVTARVPGGRSPSASVAGQIRCGVRGFLCHATAAGGRVTLRATPAAGYLFAGWTGACGGRRVTCAVQLAGARAVGARFAPRGRGAAVAVAVRRPRLRVRWRASVGRGTLVVRGRVSAAARARLDVRRPGGGPLLTKRFALPGGAFARRFRVGPRLRRGATLLPGGFVVALTGRWSGGSLPLQIRTINVPSPPEGVVRRSFVSATEGGPPVVRLPATTTQASANFQFETQPRPALPLAVTWYEPNGRVLGTASKSNRPVIVSSVRSLVGTPLTRGSWVAELRAGARIVRRLNVRVG
jgi:Divergent InlB B-repeat domain